MNITSSEVLTCTIMKVYVDWKLFLYCHKIYTPSFYFTYLHHATGATMNNEKLKWAHVFEKSASLSRNQLYQTQLMIKILEQTFNHSDCRK